VLCVMCAGHGHSDQPAGGSEAEVSATWQAHASTLRVHASLRQSKSSGDAWQPQVGSSLAVHSSLRLYQSVFGESNQTLVALLLCHK
jgi:hypothetical protein